MSDRPGGVRLAAALALLAVLGAAGRAEAQPVRVALVDHRQPTFFMELPADAAPPIPGFGAGVPHTTPDWRKRAIDAVERDMQAPWGHKYAHDTCNR